MKEGNISQLGDYDAHSVYNNTRMGLVISLCSNSNNLISLIPPKLPQILDIRDFKQHDTVMKRRRSMARCLFK